MRLPKGLYQRGNSFYLDYKDETGRRIRRSAGPDFHRALTLLHERRLPISAEGEPSLKTVLDHYLERQRIYSKPGSLRNTESAMRRLLQFFGDPPLGSLSDAHLDQFVVHRRKSGVTAKTINGDLAVLRAALNVAAKAGLVAKTPICVKMLKVAKRRAFRPLHEGELSALIEASSGRTRGILLVAMYTGFRNNEILHLQWRDIDWRNNSIRVTTKEGIWSSKNHQERSVFVPDSLIEWLRRYRSASPFKSENCWAFSTRNGTPMSTYNTCRAVRRVFEDVGIYEAGTATLHLIRHTVACNLLAGGADLETVRDWLGHSSIETTSIYLHTTSERKRMAASSLPKLI